MIEINKQLLRPDEAAAFLNISHWTIYRWVREGKLDATKIGNGSLRIFAESIHQLIRKEKL